MKSLKTYKTLDDLQSIVEANTNENLRLEYKGTRVLEKSDAGSICKAVTAFANSVGGQFIIGIEQSTRREPMKLDLGLSGPSKLDWIHQIISANTHPPVEGLEVEELSGETGFYYIITVSPSSQAPHQNSDHKYYKRRGSHSEPMEHYEIEDVRNRPKFPKAPLRLSLAKEDTVAFLRFYNTHTSDDIRDITCDIQTNVTFQGKSMEALKATGIKRLPAQEELLFVVDAIGMLLEQTPDAQFTVSTHYMFHETMHSESQTFFMADFKNSIIFHEPIPRVLWQIDKRIKDISKGIDDAVREIRKLETIADGTGLRLSQRTLVTLKDGDQLFDPYEFNVEGYKIILGISWEEAVKLSRPFHSIMSPPQAKQVYEDLPEDLREKFESRFLVNFEEA